LQHQIRLRLLHTENLGQVTSLLTLIHSQHLVQADIRAPNIIFNNNQSVLIEYDFAGEEGKVTYP
jgi:tRNA A-37 threonylcarbamoyl transferase component Bud32